jgi:hypothetical protein
LSAPFRPGRDADRASTKTRHVGISAPSCASVIESHEKGPET